MNQQDLIVGGHTISLSRVARRSVPRPLYNACTDEPTTTSTSTTTHNTCAVNCPARTYQCREHMREVRCEDFVVLRHLDRVECILQLLQVLGIDDSPIAIHCRLDHFRPSLICPGAPDAPDGTLHNSVRVVQLQLLCACVCARACMLTEGEQIDGWHDG